MHLCERNRGVMRPLSLSLFAGRNVRFGRHFLHNGDEIVPSQGWTVSEGAEDEGVPRKQRVPRQQIHSYEIEVTLLHLKKTVIFIPFSTRKYSFICREKALFQGLIYALTGFDCSVSQSETGDQIVSFPWSTSISAFHPYILDMHTDLVTRIQRPF